MLDWTGSGRRALKKAKKAYERAMWQIDQQEKELDMYSERLNLEIGQAREKQVMAWKLFRRDKEKFQQEQTIFEDEFYDQIQRTQQVNSVMNDSNANPIAQRMVAAGTTKEILRAKKIYEFNVETKRQSFEYQDRQLQMLSEKLNMEINHSAKKLQMGYDQIDYMRKDVEEQYKEAKSAIRRHYSGFSGLINGIVLPALGAMAGMSTFGGSSILTGIMGSTLATGLGALSGALLTNRMVNGEYTSGTLASLTTGLSMLPSMAQLGAQLGSGVLSILGDTNGTIETMSETMSPGTIRAQTHRSFETMQRLMDRRNNMIPGIIQQNNVGTGGDPLLTMMNSSNNQQLLKIGEVQ